MVDAVRLVVDQHGRAGRARCASSCARWTTAAGAPVATDPARCAAQRGDAQRPIPRALAVIGTYELACSERALQVLRPAGLLLVSPLNAADRAAGGAAPRADARATRAPRPRSSRARSGPRASPSSASARAPRRRSRSALVGGGSAPNGVEPGAGSWTPRRLDAAGHRRASCEAAHIQVVALAGSPGHLGRRAPARRSRSCRRRVRPAVVAPQTFDTLAFLDGARGRGRGRPRDLAARAGRAARRQRAQLRAAPTPTCTGSRRRSRPTRPTRRAQCSTPSARQAARVLQVAAALAALPAPRRAARPLGRDPDGRHHAAAPGGARGRRRARSASSGWSRSPIRCRRPGSVK